VKEPFAVSNVDTSLDLLIAARAAPGFGVLESASDALNQPIDQKGANQIHHEFAKEIEQHKGYMMALVADFVKAGKPVIPPSRNCIQVFPSFKFRTSEVSFLDYA